MAELLSDKDDTGSTVSDISDVSTVDTTPDLDYSCDKTVCGCRKAANKSDRSIENIDQSGCGKSQEVTSIARGIDKLGLDRRKPDLSVIDF